MTVLSHIQTCDLILASKSSDLSGEQQLNMREHLSGCLECQEYFAFHHELLMNLGGELHVTLNKKDKQIAINNINKRVMKMRKIHNITKFTLRTILVSSVLLIAVFFFTQLNQNNMQVPTELTAPPHSTMLSTENIAPTATKSSYQSSSIITYTVRQGDSLFSIANEFGLEPETILWSNSELFRDNPDLLREGWVLMIPPTEGFIYLWQVGDQLTEVAERFGVDPLDIVTYSGNQTGDNPETLETFSPEPDSLVIIPGGIKPFTELGKLPATRRVLADPSYSGPGMCDPVFSSIFGYGVFNWPLDIIESGEDSFSVYQDGIEIYGEAGDSVMSIDSGIIVFAGSSNHGYGNLVVIDHGNNWQSAYGNLDEILVRCGDEILQGGLIATLRQGENAAQPWLYFELSDNGEKVDPLKYLSH